MIPYWSQPVFRIGPFTFYAFGILLVVATAAGSVIFVERACALSLSRKVALRILSLLIPVGFLGAHLMYCALEDHEALFQFGGISSFGGIAGGALVLIALGTLAGHFWEWFDTASYSSVFAALIARVGCFLAHDHLGRRTSFWLSVKCDDGSRFDLASLEVIFLGLLALVLIGLGRQLWSRRGGFTFGITAFSYGWFRLLINGLQEAPRRYHGLTAEQYGALILITISLCGFWAATKQQSRKKVGQRNGNSRVWHWRAGQPPI